MRKNDLTDEDRRKYRELIEARGYDSYSGMAIWPDWNSQQSYLGNETLALARAFRAFRIRIGEGYETVIGLPFKQKVESFLRYEVFSDHSMLKPRLTSIDESYPERTPNAAFTEAQFSSWAVFLERREGTAPNAFSFLWRPSSSPNDSDHSAEHREFRKLWRPDALQTEKELWLLYSTVVLQYLDDKGRVRPEVLDSLESKSNLLFKQVKRRGDEIRGQVNVCQRGLLAWWAEAFDATLRRIGQDPNLSDEARVKETKSASYDFDRLSEAIARGCPLKTFTSLLDEEAGLVLPAPPPDYLSPEERELWSTMERMRHPLPDYFVVPQRKRLLEIAEEIDFVVAETVPLEQERRVLEILIQAATNNLRVPEAEQILEVTVARAEDAEASEAWSSLEDLPLTEEEQRKKNKKSSKGAHLARHMVNMLYIVRERTKISDPEIRGRILTLFKDLISDRRFRDYVKDLPKSDLTEEEKTKYWKLYESNWK